MKFDDKKFWAGPISQFSTTFDEILKKLAFEGFSYLPVNMKNLENASFPKISLKLIENWKMEQ